MDFEKERQQFACLIAFYIGVISPTLDYLHIMTNCIDKANDYEFPVREEYGETVIDTETAVDDAYAIATEITNDWEGSCREEIV